MRTASPYPPAPVTNHPEAWNPRFVLYAALHGSTPLEEYAQMVSGHDFTVWATGLWRLWQKDTGSTEMPSEGTLDEWMALKIRQLS